MDRPKQEDYLRGGHSPNLKANRYCEHMNKYIDYLELRVSRLTEGLDDIVTLLQNMQRDGK